MYKTIKDRKKKKPLVNSNNITKKIGGRLNENCINISKELDFLNKYDMDDCTELLDNSHKLLIVLKKPLESNLTSEVEIKDKLNKSQSGGYYDYIHKLVNEEYDKLNKKHQETQEPLNELKYAIDVILRHLEKKDNIEQFCSKSIAPPSVYLKKRQELDEKIKENELEYKNFKTKEFTCLQGGCNQEEVQEIQRNLNRLIIEEKKLNSERYKYTGGSVALVTVIPIEDKVVSFIESIYNKININYQTEKHQEIITDEYIIEQFFSLVCDYTINSDNIEIIKTKITSILNNIISDISNKKINHYSQHWIKYNLTQQSGYYINSDIVSSQISDFLKFEEFAEFDENILVLLTNLDCKSLYFFQDQHNTPNIFFTNIKIIFTEIDNFKKYYFLQDSGNYNLIYIKLQNIIDSMSCIDSLLMLKTSLKLNEMVIKLIIHINKTKIKQFFIEIVSQLYYFINYFLDKKKLKILKENDELNIFIKKFNSYVFKIQKIIFLLKNGNLISNIEQKFMINMIELYKKKILSDEEKIRFFNDKKRSSESIVGTAEELDMNFEEGDQIIDVLSENFEAFIKSHIPIVTTLLSIVKLVSRPLFFFGIIKKKIEEDEEWKKTDDEIIANHNYVKNFLKTNISISKESDIPNEQKAKKDIFMTSSETIYRIELLGSLLTVFEDMVNEHINKFYFLLEICNFIKNKCENHVLESNHHKVENHGLIRQQEKEFETETDQSVIDVKHEIKVLMNKYNSMLTIKHEYALHHNHRDEEYNEIKESIMKLIDNILTLIISLPEFTYIDGNRRYKNILHFLHFIENLHLEKDKLHIETLTKLNDILNTYLYIDFGKSAEAELEYSNLIDDISHKHHIDQIKLLSETILALVNKTNGKLIKTIRENSFIITLFISTLIKYKNYQKYECSNRNIIKVIIQLFNNKSKYQTFHRVFFSSTESISTTLINLFTHLCHKKMNDDWDGSKLTTLDPISNNELSTDDYVDYILYDKHKHKYLKTTNIKNFVKHIFKNKSQDEPSISENELLKTFFRFNGDTEVVQIGNSVDIEPEKKLSIVNELKTFLKQNKKTFNLISTNGSYKVIYGGKIRKYRNMFTRKNSCNFK